jgi:hypothetical protein
MRHPLHFLLCSVRGCSTKRPLGEGLCGYSYSYTSMQMIRAVYLVIRGREAPMGASTHRLFTSTLAGKYSIRRDRPEGVGGWGCGHKRQQPHQLVGHRGRRNGVPRMPARSLAPDRPLVNGVVGAAARQTRAKHGASSGLPLGVGS